MLAWKATKKRYLPILICDVCHQQIKDPKQGNILALRDDSSELILGWMTHKDKCDKVFTNKTRIYAWDELSPVMEMALKAPKFGTAIDQLSLTAVSTVASNLRTSQL